VQQRAGRAHDQVPGQAEQRRAKRQRARLVRAPHVPAVDYPGDQCLDANPADRRERLAVPWAVHEVQADRLDGACRQHRQRVADLSEVGAHQQHRPPQE